MAKAKAKQEVKTRTPHTAAPRVKRQVVERIRPAKRIALFNHKGGVSKTTTTFHLGWMLADKGYRVVLVDADPQCNLSGLILGYKGQTDFEAFYKTEPERNLRAGLAPAFESRGAFRLKETQTWYSCLDTSGRRSTK
jgi:signal recognition particle GTPase